jgi:chemotaxis protein CheY-P-specific phosphatase CheC
MKRYIHTTEVEGTETLEIMKETDDEYYIVADVSPFEAYRSAIRFVFDKEGILDLIKDLQEIIK